MSHVLTGEFAGVWWLPGHPERRWGGFLRLRRGEQPTVHIAGLVSDLRTAFGSDPARHPVVHGTIADGKDVTLIGGVEIGGSRNLMAPEAGDTIIEGERAYVGAHYRVESDARFRRVELWLSDLDSWLEAPRIEEEHELRRGRLVQIALKAAPTAPVHLRVADIHLYFGHEVSRIGDLVGDATITQRASIVATTGRPRSLRWWQQRVAKPLRYLVALSQERPCDIETMRLRPTIRRRDGDVEVVWAQSADVSDRASRREHWSRLLFTFEDLRDRRGARLDQWFTAVNELEPILDQFFATYRDKRTFVETRFTMTAGAAEAYHRERLGGTDAPEDEHAARMAQARVTVSSEHLDWLNGRLNNDPTFVRRMTDLATDLPDVRRLLFGPRRRTATTFARAIRDARNLRTHLDRTRGDMPKTIPLVRLTAQLAVLLEAELLARELGFPGADVAERVRRASRMRQVALAAT